MGGALVPDTGTEAEAIATQVTGGEVEITWITRKVEEDTSTSKKPRVSVTPVRASTVWDQENRGTKEEMVTARMTRARTMMMIPGAETEVDTIDVDTEVEETVMVHLVKEVDLTTHHGKTIGIHDVPTESEKIQLLPQRTEIVHIPDHLMIPTLQTKVQNEVTGGHQGALVTRMDGSRQVTHHIHNHSVNPLGVLYYLNSLRYQPMLIVGTGTLDYLLSF